MNLIAPGPLALTVGIITVCLAALEVYVIWRNRAECRGDVESTEEATSLAEFSSPRSSTSPAVRLQTAALSINRDLSDSLYDVSIAIDLGEVVALIGIRGSGQSTVLRAINGLIQVDSGNIVLDGDSLLGSNAVERFRWGLTYVPQDSPVFPFFSVEHNIRTVFKIKGVRSPEGTFRTRLENLLDLCELGAVRKEAAAVLTISQQRRLGLAMALAANPRFLLLDEPFSMYGTPEVVAVDAIINYARGQGIGVLIAEAELFAEHALSVADRGYVFSNGRIAAEGSRDELFAMAEAPKANDEVISERQARRFPF
ncbi:Lipopolysaccharide export system ATP-binding protein LptB [compost metagenome]